MPAATDPGWQPAPAAAQRVSRGLHNTVDTRASSSRSVGSAALWFGKLSPYSVLRSPGCGAHGIAESIYTCGQPKSNDRKRLLFSLTMMRLASTFLQRRASRVASGMRCSIPSMVAIVSSLNVPALPPMHALSTLPGHWRQQCGIEYGMQRTKHIHLAVPAKYSCACIVCVFGGQVQHHCPRCLGTRRART